MIVDRRKDSYDELMMLSRDARISRTRTSRWTTALIAGGILASGAYVAVSNQHINQLNDQIDEAATQLNDVKEQLAHAETEVARLNVAREFDRQNQNWFRDMAVALNLGDDIVKLADKIGSGPVIIRDSKGGTSENALSNVVWVVDGSRRFPMTAGDILWLPEAQFWVKLEDPASAGSKPNKISIHRGATVTSNTAADDVVEFRRNTDGRSGYQGYYERRLDAATGRGVATCVRLTLHEVSNKPGFVNTDYVDMEVLYHQPPESPPDGACESNNQSVIVSRP